MNPARKKVSRLIFPIFAIGLLFGMVLVTGMTNAHAATTSFADFDRRAKNGEKLSVVFFGASLTWGANASDPQLTSYRAQTAQKFEVAYPKAHFKFWDAAIGGTGSQLGLFRLERDVLRRQPDLVFLDFSANDDIYSDTPEPLASYEAIIRRILLQAHCPVVQVIFPFKWNIAPGEMAKMIRREAHLAISQAYKTGLGDAIALAKERVDAKQITIAELWPFDGVHPGDKGYALFADAAWQGYVDAFKARKVCQAPQKMLHDDTYMASVRFPLTQLANLPAGWQKGTPNLTSAWFDALMSRWQDSQVIASSKSATTARLSLKFRGTMIMLFGEGTPKSAKYRVYLGGRLLERKIKEQTVPEFDAGELARRSNGNVHHVQILATGLDPIVPHTLEIEPLFAPGTEQELRLESLCVAGGQAQVELLDR